MIAGTLLAWAAVMTYKCPCARVMSCHKMELFLTVGGAGALIAYDNAG